MRFSALFLAAILLLTWSPARADVYLEEQISRGEGAQPETMRLYANKDSLRIEEGEDEVIVYRADKQVAWYLSAADKTCIEVPWADLRNTLEQTQQAYEQGVKAIDQAIETMQKTPGVTKEQIDEMKQERAKLEVHVEDLGKETVAGHACTHVRITQAEQPAIEVWSAEDFANAAEVAQFNLYRLARESWGWYFGKVKGVPLRIVVHAEEGDAIQQRSEVVKVEEKALDAALFEIPSGYAKTSSVEPPSGDGGGK